jgi:hypothetical protein
MRLARYLLCLACLWAAAAFALFGAAAQKPPPAPPASAARILLLPRHVISGDRATLAVLDIGGRLTPGVTVKFSNGDEYKTDATGRAVFVAPLNPGVILGSIIGRRGHVPMVVVTPTQVAAASMEVSSAPRVASVADRFELSGYGFCGEADANQVLIGGEKALVLASSPASLVILPPPGLALGRASVDIDCANKVAPPLEIVFISLELDDPPARLAPGEHRSLTIFVRGTTGRVEIEARNLAPNIAELQGGNAVRVASSGGMKNLAHFEVVGRKRGKFLFSIRLLPAYAHPR